MKTLNVWESLVNADSQEGRGPMIHVGYFFNKVDAQASVKGRGVMGCGNGDVKSTEVIIYDSLIEFHSHKDEQLKASVLRKLSAEERRVLGL